MLKDEFSDKKTCGGALIGLGNTSQNLELAIKGEVRGKRDVYPACIALAQAQGERAAKAIFGWALEAEKIHAELCRKVKECVDKGEDFPINGYIWICLVCGLLGKKFVRF